jgi:signal transduction histidine kinase
MPAYAPAPESGISPAREPVILIVDDQEANVRVLERMLRQSGYQNLHTTTEPLRVIELYQEVCPDILLLDLHMPELDGFGVMEKLRAVVAEPDWIPIVVLTADVSPETRTMALWMGAKDFLTKPLDLTEVLLRIANLLEVRFLHMDLRERNSALEAAVEQRTEQLRENLRRLERLDRDRRMLLSRLLQAEEQERKRVANDIHDDAVQVMTAVHMRLQLLRKRIDDPELAELLDLEEVVRLSTERLRRLLFDLRPEVLDDEGLASALRMHLAQATATEGPDFEIESTFLEEPAPEMRAVLYRVCLEALTNVRKHASAQRVNVRLHQSEAEHLVTIRDDGTGFSLEDAQERAGHVGLTSMRERAELAGGWMRVETAPGSGTVVEFGVPA